MATSSRAILWALLAAMPLALAVDGAPKDESFPGGTNPDGSLRPSPPITDLFTHDDHTEYSILAPGSEQFRIQYRPEEAAVGATELANATRGGSEASDIEVFDPRTGKPLKFTYLPSPSADDPRTAQSGTLGLHEGRVFVAFVNLNQENNYRVSIRAHQR